MGEVYHHTQRVHLGHHFPAKRTQSSPALSLGGTVSYGVVFIVGKGDVTYAQPVEGSQEWKRFLDGRGILHAHEDGDEAFFLVARNFIGAEREDGIVLVGLAGVVGGAEHLQGTARGRIGRCAGCGVEGKEGAAHFPGLHFGKIYLYAGIVYADVSLPQQLGRGVQMGIVDHFS